MTPEFQKGQSNPLQSSRVKQSGCFIFAEKSLRMQIFPFHQQMQNKPRHTLLDLLVAKSQNENPQQANEVHQAEAFLGCF
jgi:hypothetical protein